MGTHHNDSVGQSIRHTVPDGIGTYQHGDVIDLGISELRDSHGNTIMTLQFEGIVASGSAGERLGQAQAAAIRDVLTYLANNKSAGEQEQTLEQE